MTRLSDDERGSGDVLGLVLIAPMMLFFALLIYALGRDVDAHAQVRSAAAAAAEAAALQRSQSLAQAAATTAARSALRDPTACSGGPQVVLDFSHFTPGGSVRVTVTCEPTHGDLGPIGRRGSAFSATSVATVDPLRAVAP
jgi:hypothetical protein